ncbi:hypothetical protein [Clostridium sp. YIM B02506]|uniref:hypothetical protein n=1 Tax=Clostridium sp. YIM B02506 TaxID=2910680 RepID=UPI001EEEE18C|nr:hypothetical protein [Clostridium sp. YIM B02506]
MALSKPKKVNLMAEYIDYYERLINEQGLDTLNIKIPREVFEDILDHIGSILNKKSIEMANEDGPVKEFLEANPLPSHMKELLPDDFRVFSLLLNALKQWVSAESQATDNIFLVVLLGIPVGRPLISVLSWGRSTITSPFERW